MLLLLHTNDWLQAYSRTALPAMTALLLRFVAFHSGRHGRNTLNRLKLRQRITCIGKPSSRIAHRYLSVMVPTCLGWILAGSSHSWYTLPLLPSPYHSVLVQSP